jgi:uncharacterized protein GlcG (DUF336 family)
MGAMKPGSANVSAMELVTNRASLTVPAVMVLLQGAVDHATDLAVSVYVAVMDTAGTLIGFVAPDGIPPYCADVARNKAYTAATMRMSTEAFKELLATIPAGDREAFMRHDRYMAAAGGLPVEVDGVVVAGIGVSGATEVDDAAIARAGLDRLAAASATG